MTMGMDAKEGTRSLRTHTGVTIATGITASNAKCNGSDGCACHSWQRYIPMDTTRDLGRKTTGTPTGFPSAATVESSTDAMPLLLVRRLCTNSEHDTTPFWLAVLLLFTWEHHHHHHHHHNNNNNS